MKLNKRAVAFGLVWAVVLGGLYLTTLFSYLLFHTLAEVFSSAVGVAIFMLIWNVRRSLDNNYLLFLGVAYLFIGGLDLVHSLSYKGMGVFTGYDENLPTQLWIGVRYLQSISLLVAPLFLGKRLSLRYVVAAYFLASSFIVGAVFYWDIFPACFVPGQGLTTFKKVSEYVIAGILIASIALLLKKRDQLDPTVFRLLVVSISLTIASEWCFTMYADVYGFFNLIGHFLKVLAFYCIYKAIIELGMAKPFAVLFRNLKESEEALRRERDFIAAVLSTAGALVIVLDREGRIVRFNRACEQLTGYSFGEVRGRFFWDLFLIPEEVEPVKKVFEQLRLGNFPYDNENHWVAKDGNRRMIRWANTALPGHSGVIEFVIGIGIDITERKKAEEALKKAHDVLEQRVEERTAHLVKACEKLTRQILERRRAEESLELEKIKLRSILDSMADGVYMANQQGLIEYANPALEKEFGSAVGRRCYEYLEGRNEQCPWCKNGEIFYGKSNQYEWYSKKTGKTYEIFDTPVLNVDGTTARLEILHDITARKKAEAAVRESEMKYRIVADYTYDWEWWRGSDGKFIYVSPSCKDITSHGVEEFMSDPDLFFRIVHPEDQPSFQGHVAGIEDKDLSGEFEFRIIRPDGSFRWIAHGCRPVFDEQGIFKGRRGSNRDITERKKAEESTLIALSEIKILKEREARFYSLLENSSLGIFQYSPDEEIIMVNPAYADIFGYSSPEDVIESVKNIGNTIYLDPARREEIIKYTRKHPEMCKFENYYRRKDGSIFTGELHIRLVRDCSGKELYFEGFVEDITERKQAEKALTESEVKWRTLYGSLPGGSFVVSRDYIIQDVNDLLCKITGYRREELVGEKCGIICPKGPHKCPIFDMGKEFLTNDETAVKARNGYKVPVLKSVRRLPVTDRELIIENFHDITVLKEAERALASEKELLAVTLRSIGDGVIATDIEKKITLINNVAELLTGWSRDDAEGKPLSDIFRVMREKSGKECEDSLDKAIKSRETVEFGEYKILISKNGRERIIADTVSPIRDKDNNIMGFILVFRDMTEKRTLEMERMKAQHLESLGVLAGGIAHDFNNLLTSILANVSLARQFIKPRDKSCKRLMEAEKACYRAKSLTKQLLTFSRGGVPVKKTVYIENILKDTTDFALRGSNVKSEFFVPHDLWPVEIDEGQFYQAINNMVINAYQAMPEGGILKVSACNVEITPEDNLPLTENKYIKITLEDRGIGIAEKDIPKIFDPYFTTKEKASGLGLATVYSIIKQHGGYIRVNSALNRGTVFSIYLPVSEKEVFVKKEEEEGTEEIKGKILIMDDEEIILDVASEALTCTGYDVCVCKNGEEAIRLYREAMEKEIPFDAVIMDLTIPGGMGGKEAIKKILELDPEVKGIVSSGYS
ncbi:MAG: PAS domain S-box protein, partial [Desulfobacteraceae bacterium]